MYNPGKPITNAAGQHKGNMPLISGTIIVVAAVVLVIGCAYCFKKRKDENNSRSTKSLSEAPVFSYDNRQHMCKISRDQVQAIQGKHPHLSSIHGSLSISNHKKVKLDNLEAYCRSIGLTGSARDELMRIQEPHQPVIVLENYDRGDMNLGYRFLYARIYPDGQFFRNSVVEFRANLFEEKRGFWAGLFSNANDSSTAGSSNMLPAELSFYRHMAYNALKAENVDGIDEIFVNFI